MVEFYSERWGKAKMEHCCECCGKTIEVGDEYSRQVGKYYGDFFSRALCPICACMVSEYCENVDDEFNWDDVQEYAREETCHKCRAFEDCEICITDCAKVKEFYKNKYGRDGGNA